MTYIRESWYPASWAEDLTREPVGRVFLEEEVVLYRCESGEPVALANACPHRFAALSKGRIHGDAIACPYHGLQFSPDGQCSHNPHGPAPKSVRVRSYPLTERYGMVWIWMGDPDAADVAKLPKIPAREDDRFDWVSGALHVEGNYQLVIDNLLDLTHVQFMHPFLANLEDTERPRVKCFEEGESVVSRYLLDHSHRSPLVEALWDGAPDRVSMVTEMRWSAPANLIQGNNFDLEGDAESFEGRLQVPLCHLLTPETSKTTHYFWAAGRNMKTGIPQVSEGMGGAISATFKGEDEPMIADIQKRMGDRDLMDMRPLLLSIDKSAVLARRRVTARIEDETKRTQLSGQGTRAKELSAVG